VYRRPDGGGDADPRVVFSGSMDGHLRAYETGGGKIIWDYDR